MEFLEVVSPKIALIGVGKNNKFGHPNDEVIERLEERNIKIFRTDSKGEITIIVNKKGNMSIKKQPSLWLLFLYFHFNMFCIN